MLIRHRHDCRVLREPYTCSCERPSGPAFEWTIYVVIGVLALIVWGLR